MVASSIASASVGSTGTPRKGPLGLDPTAGRSIRVLLTRFLTSEHGVLKTDVH